MGVLMPIQWGIKDILRLSVASYDKVSMRKKKHRKSKQQAEMPLGYPAVFFLASYYSRKFPAIQIAHISSNFIN
jgi:hypothetical protein